jgi:prolyl oligopeptidase PreP (S9A serine peptidase family)
MNRRDAVFSALSLAALRPSDSLAQAAAPLATATGPLPPVLAFFGRPLLGAAVLSPLGTKVAMRVTPAGKGHARLAVFDLETQKAHAVAAITNSHIDDIQWVDDERLVFDTEVTLTDFRRVDYGPGLFSVDAHGGSIRELVQARPGGSAAAGSGSRGALHWHFSLLQPAPPQAGDEVLVYRPEEISKERLGHYELLWLNAHKGGRRDVEAPLHAQRWVFDFQRRLRAVVTRQGTDLELLWRDADGPWRLLRRGTTLEGNDWQPLFVDEQDRLYVSAGHRGRAALFTVDTQEARLSATPLLSHPVFDVRASFIVSESRLVGLRYTIDAEVTHWLDAQAKTLQARVDALMPSTSNRLSLPQRGNSPWVMIEAGSDQQPTRTLAYNRQTQKMVRLGDRHPEIDARRMAQTDFVQFKARDGRNIPAWLTLPPGRGKTALPLVVWVHGGPWSRGMRWRWHPEVQFLASRGYAVLQPEFRGSTGYGHAHFRAGWRQWGQAMQTDLADAARWAIEEKVADPARIALLGASYGGYATLMGLVQEPELFRAGVAWAAVTDLQMMYSLQWSDILGETKRYGLPRLLGDPVADAQMLKAQSPLQQAARLRSPLLLAHGGWDARVPVVHFEAMRDALKAHNPQLQAVLYPEEGHGWMHTETLSDFWSRVERFLEQHLAGSKGGADTAPAPGPARGS